MDTNNRRSANNKRKAAIAQSIPSPPQAVAPGIPGGVSALSWFAQATIILALVTLVGSWYVLFFEVGYFDYFHIPYYFVSLSPSIALGTSWLWVKLLLYLCGLAVAMILGISFLGWLGKHLKKKRGERDEIREPVALIFVLGVVCVCLSVVYATFGAQFFRNQGYEYAKSLDEFPVFPSPPSMTIKSPEVAVLRVYGEYVYAVPFNRGTNGAEFEKELVIVKMSDIKAPLSLQKIGPLRAKP